MKKNNRGQFNAQRPQRKGEKTAPKTRDAAAVQLIPWLPKTMTDNVQLSPVVGQIWVTVKSTESSGFLGQASATAFNQFAGTLATLCGEYSTISGVFDQYRIDLIEHVFRPRVTTASTAQSSGTGLIGGYYTTCLDYDDSTPLTSMQAAQNYDNAITSSVLEGQRRCYRPRIAVAAYSGTFTSYKNEPAGWIDIASTGVVHYGMKCAIDAYTGTNNISVVDMFTRAQISFRASR
jgi:hypothetical protein